MSKKQYPFRIPLELLKKLQAKAKEDRRSVNQTIELAIEEYIKQKP